MNAIIVDIDGTISNYDHRRHWIPVPAGSNRSDTINPNIADRWERFHTEAIHDKPIAEVVSILKWMKSSCPTNKIILITGRSDKHRQMAKDWLHLHRIPHDRLLMRHHGDWRRDVEVKRDLFEKHCREYNILFALEDRDCVTELWRSLGIRCLQVAKGEY